VKYSPSGEVLVDLALESAVMDLAIDPQGDLWIATELDTSSEDHMFRLAPDGTTIETFAVVSGMKAIAMDSSGRPWVSNHGTPQRFMPGQRTPIASFNFFMDAMTVDLSVDSHGHVWLVSGAGVACYQADGTKLLTAATVHADVETSFGACAITIDTNGDIWAIDGQNVLRKFNHAGVQQGEWPGYGRAGLTTFGASSQRLMPDPRGGVWVRSPSTLTRLDAAGQVVTTLTFSADQPAGGLAVDASGLWLSYGGQVHRFTF
jgi:streptogramin lyase